jgi:hypothetical protein
MVKPRSNKLPWSTGNGEYAERKLNAVEAQAFYAELRGKVNVGGGLGQYLVVRAPAGRTGP